MNKIVIAIVTVSLSGCVEPPEPALFEIDPFNSERALPLLVKEVIAVGECTESLIVWDRTVYGKCSVKLNDGTVTSLTRPVMLGKKVIVCPEHTNNIDNEYCAIHAYYR